MTKRKIIGLTVVISVIVIVLLRYMFMFSKYEYIRGYFYSYKYGEDGELAFAKKRDLLGRVVEVTGWEHFTNGDSREIHIGMDGKVYTLFYDNEQGVMRIEHLNYSEGSDQNEAA